MLDTGTVVTGALKASTVNASGIPIDMESQTKDLMPQHYTTQTLIKNFGADIQAKNMVHKYRERRPIPNYTSISVADAAAATNIEVADPTFIQDDHVLWIIRDGVILMQLLVQDTAIDATVDIVKFEGTTGSGGLPVATAVGDIVIIGPEAHAEGEAVPDPYTNISVDQEDYLMQIDRAVKKTDIEGAIGHYDEQEKKLAKDLKVAWIEEKQKINLFMYLGIKTRETTSASARRYAFHGLFQRITENVENFNNVGSGFTQQALQESLRNATDNAALGGTKVLVSGVNINNAISSWPEGAVRIRPGSAQKWGVQINTIQTQYGTIGNVYDNLLNERFGLADRGVILDSAHTRRMHLQGLKMRAFMDITGKRDIHNMEHAISGTAGIQLSSNESHVQIKGVS